MLLFEITGVKPVWGDYAGAGALCSTYPWWSDISQNRTITNRGFILEKMTEVLFCFESQATRVNISNDKLAH